MERRVVTAVFVDIVGSTALIVQLGPERFKRALDRAFAELRAIIEAESGTVANVIGDAIFALFGVPAAHPDDPLGALRAACACVRWAEGRGTATVPLAVRIGVETGEVLVDLTTGERLGQQTSVGTCVNLAARLQQLACPGQILVGPTCYQVTAELGTFAPLGAVELKGLGEQLVWRLIGLGDLATRTRLPFIGREAELALLRVAYQRARSGRSVFAVVSGPPGQGKTRLIEEFLAEVATEARALRARCRPAAELTARGPLRELLTSDGAEQPAESLADRLIALFPDALERDRVFTALAHSAGIVVSHDLTALPAGQRQDEIENGWRRYLSALARGRPLVLWLDDIHWAEAEIVRLLDRLTLGVDLPVLVVATARPEFATQAGMRTGGNRFFIGLDALDGNDARALARHAGSADPTGIERAEGNPLFIIELARARKISATPEVPITLKGIIGARLDELARQDHELLQCVAVVGESFTLDDATLLSGHETAVVANALDRLTELAYLRPVIGGYRFHHALVHDVAYGRLATAERMQLHARFARHGAPDDAETLAHHLWEAVGGEDAEWVWEGSEELDLLRGRAREALLAASRRYADRGAYERAIETSRRALLLAKGTEDVGKIEQAIGNVFSAKGDAEEAWTHYMRARERYRAAGLEPPANLYPSLLELHVYTSGMFVRPPDRALVETLFREGEAVVRAAADVASLARLLALRAYQSLDAAQMSEALRVSETVTDPASLGSFLEHAAILQVRVGDFAAARRSYERLDSLGTPGVAPDRRLEFRAILALNFGRLEEAEGLAARYLEIGASRGPHLRTHAYREQCHVLLALGQWRDLRELAQETERLVSEYPETAFCYAVSTALAFAAVASAIEGKDQDARALLSRAEAPLQAEPLERESVLLLASGAVGRSDKVDELRRSARQHYAAPLWFFNRTEAVVLTMLERWDEVNEVLPHLERVAAKSGSRYIDALVTAIREEMTAARGGPAATHRTLRELGYIGWSRLLSHRPLTM